MVKKAFILFNLFLSPLLTLGSYSSIIKYKKSSLLNYVRWKIEQTGNPLIFHFKERKWKKRKLKNG